VVQDRSPFEETAENGFEADSSQPSEMEEQLRAAEEKARTYLANWQRTQADLENLRKRAQQEKREALDFANSTLMTKLMNAFDDLERAFSRPAAEMRKASWVEGARLSFEKLKGVLQSEGVQQIEAVGQPFDPRYHQAIMRQPGQDGIVLDEVQKGYIMNGRVLRPSMVVVGQQEDNGDSEQ